MKRILFSVVVAFMFAISVSAQDKVVVNKNSGDMQSYEMSDIRKITFGDNSIVVVAQDGSATATISYDEIKKITFELADGIEQVVSTEQGKLTLLKEGNTIKIKGFNGKEGRLAIYSANGTMVESSTFSGDNLSVGIDNLPDGLYILNVNGQSIKFTK
ncbi:MAG: T9SS type A sorting domain-containing protein [Prevotella sp.]|nr:T9SS type A sorting domain-containing protein [Prevotella sp.]MBQ9669710.1 T9SS type A sorting domain-containing protein [Prevotella sp.]